MSTSNNRLNEEAARLETFHEWTIPFIDKSLLARYGFYYVGPGDKVKCYFCRAEIGSWDQGDNVLREHMRWSPYCPLIKRAAPNNVAIDATALDESLPPPSFDICGTNEVEIRPNSYPENQPPPRSPITSPFTNNHPDYTLESDRIRSFECWPKAIKQKPAELSEAGFFYIGKGDQVKCFSCGGGLKDWEEPDIPWEQHALWYPKCHYLNLIKGREYIERIRQDYDAETVSNGAPGRCATPDPAQEHKSLAASTSPTVKSKDEQKNIPDDDANDSKLCKICFTNELDAALIPCMHIIACAKCAVALKKCPICRKEIHDVKRIFFS